MLKSTRILLLLVVVLGIAYYMFSKKPWRTAPKSAEDFAINDTSEVTKIFMANKRGEKILLERQPDNSWRVNGRFSADEPKIKLLLSTLHDMRIQMPIPPSMHNTAIAILASKGIKTEIYAGEKLIKTVYVGSETPDKTGTFMILEGENEPYIIHIPGFVGFLTPRFFLTEIKWRNKLLFDIPAENIAFVQVAYPKNDKESFSYEHSIFQSKGAIQDYSGALIPADTQQVKMFLHSFTQKFVEGYYEDSVFTPHERDSLYKTEPWCRMRVKLKTGAEQQINLYEKPIGDKTKDRYDEQGNELSIDPEKFFAKIDDIDQIASIQEYAFRRVLVKASQLRKK